MTRKIFIGLACGIGGIAGFFALDPMARVLQPKATAASPAPAPPSTDQTTPGRTAIARIHELKRYAFVLFWKQDDAATRGMRRVLQSALRDRTDRAAMLEVRITDPAERPLADLYGLDRAPMPLALALAPNGAITGGFTEPPGETEIAGAFVSAAMASCMKAAQEQKLVILTVQPAGTPPTVPPGVREFQADARFAAVTEAVTFGANDRAEQKFLKTLQVDPRTATAVTMILVPPGQMIAKYEGQVTKEILVSEVTNPKHGSACAGGVCGPNGCGSAR